MHSFILYSMLVKMGCHLNMLLVNILFYTNTKQISCTLVSEIGKENLGKINFVEKSSERTETSFVNENSPIKIIY